MTTQSREAGRKSTGTAGDGHHDLRILNAIRQIIRAADVDSRKLAAEHQVTAPQLMSLMALVEKGPLTAIEIARRIHVSASTLVGVLDRLEAKRLVQRERSEEDRREIAITITAAGRELAASTPFPLQYTLGRALTQLNAAEREDLARGMERLVELMGVESLESSPMLEIVSVSKRQR